MYTMLHVNYTSVELGVKGEHSDSRQRKYDYICLKNKILRPPDFGICLTGFNIGIFLLHKQKKKKNSILFTVLGRKKCLCY